MRLGPRLNYFVFYFFYEHITPPNLWSSNKLLHFIYFYKGFTALCRFNGTRCPDQQPVCIDPIRRTCSPVSRSSLDNGELITGAPAESTTSTDLCRQESHPAHKDRNVHLSSSDQDQGEEFALGKPRCAARTQCDPATDRQTLFRSVSLLLQCFFRNSGDIPTKSNVYLRNLNISHLRLLPSGLSTSS